MIEQYCYFLVFIAASAECASSPCLNGATCYQGDNAYVCMCAFGYTGENCQTGMSILSCCNSSPSISVFVITISPIHIKERKKKVEEKKKIVTF